ncbi:MAG: carbohydrate binding family 9 domain-containing protein [Candidatus Aminicenantes bacterium]|nr:carbohydrate binding family 9 domain-containing protein [Candidatus Aminicenantes bacterium]
MIKRTAIFAALIAVAAALASQEEPPAIRTEVAPATSAIRIDGVIDEEAWKNGPVITLPTEWYPGDNTPAPVDTDCLLTYDRHNLYIAFRCHDPEPRKIRAHLMDRDAIDTFVMDDHVSVMLDTFNDERRAFQFRVNPLGVQADANYSEQDGYEDFSWDAIWSSAGRITALGYEVEIAIPFHQLRFRRTAGKQTWGFSAGRSWPRGDRHRMDSQPRDRDNNCVLCQFNKITGLENISPGSNIELDPTLTVQRSDAHSDFPGGAMTAGTIQAEPGLTVKWGITPNLILNAAVNPDFSQIEADAAQLDVNTRYALYYPEKRPFFLEGADIFLTPFEAVFTRTVADPLWGVKLTGKVGRGVLGFFAAQDRINNLIIPSNQGSEAASLDEDVFAGVLRYRRDIGNSSTLGILYAGRSGGDYYNHVGGIDGFFRLGKRDQVRFQYVRSETRYSEVTASAYGQDDAAFPGDAFYAEYVHQSRNWFIYGAYIDKGKGFRADSGFVSRVDTRMFDSQIQYNFWGKSGSAYNRLSFWLRAYRTCDHDGLLTDSRIALGGVCEGPLQSTATLIARANREHFAGILYNIDDLYAEVYVKPFSGFSLGVYVNPGHAVDYANERPAKRLLFGPYLEAGIGRHLNLNLNHSLERLSSEGRLTYTANLLQAKLIYTFSVRAFARAILQYRDVDRVPESYAFKVERASRSLFSQLLFSYKINARTVLFLGYSGQLQGNQDIDLTRSNRAFFLKMGYALGI